MANDSIKRTRKKSATKKSRGKPVSRARAQVRGRPSGVLVDLRKADGCAAGVLVAERSGGETDSVEGASRVVNKTGVRAKGRSPRLSSRTCTAMAAIGHPVRAQLLSKLLEGPATYQTLRKATKLKAGPLYHHIGHLRLAGLILPKQRDLYELTRGGRNLVLVAIALEPMLKDGRRRPLGANA